jgi:hypothetical protein
MKESRLLTLLQGKSLIAANKKDRRGWGQHSGSYTVSEGYNFAKETLNAPPIWPCGKKSGIINLF